MLTPKQLETVKQQLAVAESVDEGGELDAQLQQLLLKHFMLHVGVDVSKAEFVVAVKNASYQVLLSGKFENHHRGFEQFIAKLNQLNGENVYQIKVAIECTGPYHLSLVRFLQAHGICVYLYNGQTAKHLAKARSKRRRLIPLMPRFWRIC